jgi:hypothetical protein
LGLTAPFAAADSITVTYSATNVSDSQWGYSYTVSGSLSSGDLLAIYFPQATSSNLTDTSTISSEFATSVLQPDAAIPADGEFDIAANAATTDFPDTFDVLFNYSGTGAPGAQSFTLADSSFAPIESDSTVAAGSAVAPEPGSLVLLCLGMFGLLFGYLRSKKPKVSARTATVLAFMALSISLPHTATAQTGPPGGGTPLSGGTPPTGGFPGGGGATTSAVSGMTIGSYHLLSSYRYSANQYYYTYNTSVNNTNSTAYSYVLGTLTSSNANTVVVSGSVEFGHVPAGGTVAGLTAFTILQDRRYAFDPSSLSWSFTGSSSSSTTGTTQSSVSLSASSISSSYGTGVNLTAAVAPATSTGTVTFYDGPTPVGTATLTSGTASLSDVALPTGSHSLSAVYGGDTTYALSSSSPEVVTIGTGGAVTSCSGLQQTALVVCLANAFEATLTSSQISTVQLEYTLANAAVWTNLPANSRNGLEFSSLTSTQLAAALQLAQSAMSSEGYQRFQNIRGADNVLGNYTSGYGSGNYFIAVLGTPSTTSPWQLQIGGHHFAFNHTFNGQYTSGTPYFIGNEPAMYNVAGTLYLPMQGPRDAAYALTRSVYGNSAALLSGTYDDVLLGSSGVDAYPHTYPTTGRGIPYTSLTSAQQAQVKTVIEAWVNDMDSTTATSLLSTYEDATALANTYVGYSGTGTLTTQGDYIRVDGPRVWIEFCVQNGIVFNQSYHFHTIWRDKTADYGGDFVGQ